MARSRKDIFAILVRENRQALLAFVRSCVAEPSAADDVVQETFLTAWRRLDEFDRSRPFIIWLRGIARNKILEHHRSCATRRRYVAHFTPEALERIALEHERLVAGTGDAFIDQVRPLRECLDTLGHDARSMVDFHYRERQTCRAIGVRLGMGVEAVKKGLQRARAALRRCIVGKLEAGDHDG